MGEAYDNSIYRGYLVNGDLLGAMGYLEQFPEKSGLCGKYRAKPVELIYARRRNLLAMFLSEADASQAGNGHALAAEDIDRGFANHLGCPREALGNLPVEEIQKTAGLLFRESCRELRARYG